MRSITPKKEALSTQSKVKESKVKESKEKKTHSLCSFVSRERESESERVSEREQWQIWKNELLADEDWRASATRQSGQGVGFNTLLPAKLNDFCDFIISCGEKKSVVTRKDFVRRFHYWLSYQGMKRDLAAADKGRPRLSKIEEMNRVGDASLEIAKRILAGKCS